MRALITFIAILTVGIVTAQDANLIGDPATFQGNIPYDEVAETIVVGGETYEITGDMLRDLNYLYPNGTSKIYHYKREIDLISNHLTSIDFDHVPGVSSGPDGTGRQGYRVRLLFNDPSTVDPITSISYEPELPNEANENPNRLDVGYTTPRGVFGDNYATGFGINTLLEFENDFSFVSGGGQSQLYVDFHLRYLLPEQYHSYPTDNVSFHSTQVLSDRRRIEGDGFPTSAQAFDPATILVGNNTRNYINRHGSLGHVSLGLHHGETPVRALLNGNTIPFTFDYIVKHFIAE